jgi:hypothetical protein
MSIAHVQLCRSMRPSPAPILVRFWRTRINNRANVTGQHSDSTRASRGGWTPPTALFPSGRGACCPPAVRGRASPCRWLRHRHPAARGHPADPALYAVRLRAPASIGPLGWGWTPHRPPGCPRACGEGEAGASPPAHAPALGRLKSLGRFVPGGAPQPLGNLAGARCASGACAAPAAWPAAMRRHHVWPSLRDGVPRTIMESVKN